MSTSRQTEKIRGQALVELAFILPVLLLFMSVVVPLVVSGTIPMWMDERLNLRQLGQDEEQVQHQLERTHDSNHLQPYFEKAEIDEDTRTSDLSISAAIPGNIFPGTMTRKLSTVTLAESRWWNRKILGNPQERDRTLTRGLSLVTARVPVEARVPEEVKRWTVVGFAPGVTGILEKSNVGLFHLNLDALPEAFEGGSNK